jgi:hypothetical protein
MANVGGVISSNPKRGANAARPCMVILFII